MHDFPVPASPGVAFGHCETATYSIWRDAIPMTMYFIRKSVFCERRTKRYCEERTISF